MLAQPYWLIAYNIMDVGGGVPDAPCNLALLQNLWFTVGADSISARATMHNRPTARRGQDPSLQTNHKLSSNPQNRNPAQSPGASRTPPPTHDHTVAVGANSVRPLNLALLQGTTGGYRIRPYANQKFGPGGVRRREVKKR